MTKLKNVAVVLAGGVGARVGLGIPKQLIKIAGRTIIEHTLEVFQAHPGIDDVMVMMTPGHLDDVREMVRRGRLDKVSRILEGSGTRNDTTKAALAALGEEQCNVILHDAVRPLVSPEVVDRVIEALGLPKA